MIIKLNEDLCNEKYFSLMSYIPGNAETGIEGDRFDIWDVTTANSEDEAYEKFEKLYGKEPEFDNHNNTFFNFILILHRIIR